VEEGEGEGEGEETPMPEIALPVLQTSEIIDLDLGIATTAPCPIAHHVAASAPGMPTGGARTEPLFIGLHQLNGMERGITP